MEIAVALIAGVFIGAVAVRLIFWPRVVGSLLIVGLMDGSDDKREEPEILLELSKELGFLCSRKRVTLDVSVTGYIPRN